MNQANNPRALTELEQLNLNIQASRQALEIELALWDLEMRRRAVPQMHDVCLVDAAGNVHPKFNVLSPEMLRDLERADLHELHLHVATQLRQILAALSPNDAGAAHARQ